MHLLPHHPRARALLALAVSGVLLFAAIAFAALAVEDIRYGLSLPLVELGFDEAQTYVAKIPWLAVFAACASAVFSTILLHESIRTFRHKGLLNEEKLLDRPIFSVIFIVLALGLLSVFTPIDNKLAAASGLDYFRSFSSFTSDYVIVGVIVEIGENSIIIKDSSGQILELQIDDATRDIYERDGIGIGDEIAVQPEKPRSSFVEDEDEEEASREPIVIPIEPGTPIVVGPIFDDPTPSPETPVGYVSISVRAKGDTGQESVRLKIKDKVVKSWTLSAQYSTYNYSYGSSVFDRDIKFEFINDGGGGADKNARVDYIRVGGRTFQTEASSVYSTGTYSSNNGCGGGYKTSETLHCNGYFNYSIGDAGLINGDAQPSPVPEPQPEQPEPTPEPTPTPDPVPTPVIEGNNDLVELIISDTWADNGSTPPWAYHDAPANVGTSYDFYRKARSGFWNDDTYAVFQPWCWIYSPAGTRMTHNFRVEMKPAKFYFYYDNTKTWREVSYNGGWSEGTFGRIDGQTWVQTGGTKSLGNNTYDIKNNDSYSFHPWSKSRLDNDNSADGALQLVELRILDSSGNPVSDAKGYQAHCQWDGYQGHGTDEGARPAAYLSRAKYLSGSWQTFSSITIPYQNPGSNQFNYDTAASQIRQAMATHPLVQ